GVKVCERQLLLLTEFFPHPTHKGATPTQRGRSQSTPAGLQGPYTEIWAASAAFVGAGLPWPDLGERWPSRLVATAEEDRLSLRRSPLGPPGARWTQLRPKRLTNGLLSGCRPKTVPP